MKDKPPKGSDFATLKRVIKLAFPFKRLFIISVVFALVTAIRPFIIQKIIDVNIIELNGKGIGVAAIILFAVIFAEFIMKYIFGLNTTRLGQSIMLE